MTQKREGQKTNWYSEIHIRLERRGKGFVNFKIANHTYSMRYGTFLKMNKQLHADYKFWKWQKEHKKIKPKIKLACAVCKHELLIEKGEEKPKCPKCNFTDWKIKGEK